MYLELRPSSSGPMGAALTKNVSSLSDRHCARVKTMMGMSWRGSSAVHRGCLMLMIGPRAMFTSPCGPCVCVEPTHSSTTIEYPFQPSGSEKQKPYCVFLYWITDTAFFCGVDVACWVADLCACREGELICGLGLEDATTGVPVRQPECQQR